MHVLLVGASHRTAPVELRERLDFCSRGLDRAVIALAGRESTSEAVVVSTCNRAELYVACGDPSATFDDLVTFFSEFQQVPAARIRPHLYSHVNRDAARHLFRVASGLDSLVVGEPQILGQVKEAYGVASTVQATGPLLNKLFHWAFAVGKRVRSETALAEGAVSVSFAAVSLAKKIFGNLAGAAGACRRHRRNGKAHGDPPQGAGHWRARDHQPDAESRAGARRRGRRHCRCVGTA